MNELDQGLAALISDLDERGLLAETIVLVMGEVGRTNRTICQPRSTKPSAFRTTRAPRTLATARARSAKGRRDDNDIR
jgi:hypothetical protein